MYYKFIFLYLLTRLTLCLCPTNSSTICISNIFFPPNNFISLVNSLNYITTQTEYIYLEKNVFLNNTAIAFDNIVVNHTLTLTSHYSVSRRTIFADKGEGVLKIINSKKIVFKEIGISVQDPYDYDYLVLLENSADITFEDVFIDIDCQNNHHPIVFKLMCDNEECGNMTNYIKDVEVNVIKVGAGGVTGIDIMSTYDTDMINLYNHTFFDIDNIQFTGRCYKGVVCPEESQCNGLSVKNSDFSPCIYAIHQYGDNIVNINIQNNEMKSGGDGKYFYLIDTLDELEPITKITIIDNNVKDVEEGIYIEGMSPQEIIIKDNTFENSLNGISIIESQFVNDSVREIVVDHNQIKSSFFYGIFINFNENLYANVGDLYFLLTRNYFMITGESVAISFNGIGVKSLIENNIFEKDEEVITPFVNFLILSEPYTSHVTTIQNNIFVCSKESFNQNIVLGCDDDDCYTLNESKIVNNLFVEECSSYFPLLQFVSSKGKLCENGCEFSFNALDFEPFVVYQTDEDYISVGEQTIYTSNITFSETGSKAQSYWIPNSQIFNHVKLDYSPDYDINGISRYIKDIQGVSWISPGPFEMECTYNRGGRNCSQCKDNMTCCPNRFEGEDCSTCNSHWNKNDDCKSCSGYWYGYNCQSCPGNWDYTTNCFECRNKWWGKNCEYCNHRYDVDSDCSTCAINYYGDNCNTTTCNGIPSNNDTVCSGRGACVQYDVCNCLFKYAVGFCEDIICFGYSTQDEKVCSGMGDCLQDEQCNCEFGWAGKDCSSPVVWWIIWSLSGTVFVTFSIIVCMLIGMLSWKLIYKLIKYRFRVFFRKLVTVKKFDEIDVLLQEQNNKKQDIDVSHLIFDDKIFNIDYDEVNVLKQIGKGSRSSIFHVILQNRDEDYALKIYNICNFASDEKFTHFKREVRMLSTLKHPNLLKYYGCTYKPTHNRVGIVFEHCSKGTLKSFLKKYSNIDFKTRIDMLAKIADAMNYLHGQNIIHRELSSDNILLTKDENVKVVDFGLSRIYDKVNPQTVDSVGSNSYYMSPELVLGKNYNKKVDVFSYGIIAYEIITGNFDPFNLKRMNASDEDVVLGMGEVESDLDGSGGNTSANRIEFRIATNADVRPVISNDLIKKHEWLVVLMKMCWDANHEVRPNFDGIIDILKTKKIEQKLISIKVRSKFQDASLPSTNVDVYDFSYSGLEAAIKKIDKWRYRVPVEFCLPANLTTEEKYVEEFDVDCGEILKKKEQFLKLRNNSVVIVEFEKTEEEKYLFASRQEMRSKYNELKSMMQRVRNRVRSIF